MLGTPAAPYTDATTIGTAQNNKAAPSVANHRRDAAVGLAGTSNSIAANFAAGDTITVNGTVVTFVAAGAVGNQLNVTDDISTLLAKIDSITGTAHPVHDLRRRRSRCIPAPPPISRSPVRTRRHLPRSASPAPRTATRGGGGTVGTGQVVGNDNSTFLDEIRRRRRGDHLRRLGRAGEPAVPLGQDRQRLARRRPYRHLEPVLPGQSQRHRHATWPGRTSTPTSPSRPQRPDDRRRSLPSRSPTPSSTACRSAIPSINFGTGGVTQFADANGNVQVNQIQQDGFPAGQLQSVGVSTNGRIVGNYSNGRNLDLAEITLATFNGTNFLKRVDGGAFEATDESGQALYGKAGTIVGSSLEGSNTDIADEFTKLIVTQQAYSANTKVITTSNTMVQDLLNVLR